MKFGDYLREAREQRGWTQPEAALKAQIEQSYLSKLETGKSYPSEDVFERLVAVYDLDIGRMTETISETEISNLRDIKDVRLAVLGREKAAKGAVRAWLIAALIMLMSGGGLGALSVLGEDQDETLYTYKSYGVIEPDEPLRLFTDILRPVGGTGPGADAARERRAELLRRLDEDVVRTYEYRGAWYVNETSEGRRYYEQAGEANTLLRSPLRWLFVPSLMLLFGSAGCFFISFRWR